MPCFRLISCHYPFNSLVLFLLLSVHFELLFLVLRVSSAGTSDRLSPFSATLISGACYENYKDPDDSRRRWRRTPAVFGDPAPEFSDDVYLEHGPTYLYALLFTDMKIFDHYRRDHETVRREVMKLAREANKYLYQLNLRLLIVDVMETYRDDLNLYAFEHYHNQHLPGLPYHNFAALLSFKHAGGLAFVGGMCTPKNIMVSGFYPQQPEAMGSIFFHEIAHLLGVPHRLRNDTFRARNCRCPPVQVTPPPTPSPIPLTTTTDATMSILTTSTRSQEQTFTSRESPPPGSKNSTTVLVEVLETRNRSSPSLSTYSQATPSPLLMRQKGSLLTATNTERVEGCLRIPGFDHDCTIQEMANAISLATCLSREPRTIAQNAVDGYVEPRFPSMEAKQLREPAPSVALCGNGIREGGEQCDCGPSPKLCAAWNCDPVSCTRPVPLWLIWLCGFCVTLAVALPLAAFCYFRSHYVFYRGKLYKRGQSNLHRNRFLSPSFAKKGPAASSSWRIPILSSSTKKLQKPSKKLLKEKVAPIAKESNASAVQENRSAFFSWIGFLFTRTRLSFFLRKEASSPKKSSAGTSMPNSPLLSSHSLATTPAHPQIKSPVRRKADEGQLKIVIVRNSETPSTTTIKSSDGGTLQKGYPSTTSTLSTDVSTSSNSVLPSSDTAFKTKNSLPSCTTTTFETPPSFIQKSDSTPRESTSSSTTQVNEETHTQKSATLRRPRRPPPPPPPQRSQTLASPPTLIKEKTPTNVVPTTKIPTASANNAAVSSTHRPGPRFAALPNSSFVKRCQIPQPTVDDASNKSQLYSPNSHTKQLARPKLPPPPRPPLAASKTAEISEKSCTESSSTVTPSSRPVITVVGVVQPMQTTTSNPNFIDLKPVSEEKKPEEEDRMSLKFADFDEDEDDEEAETGGNGL